MKISTFNRLIIFAFAQLKFIITYMVNLVFYIFGHTKVYDLEFGKDITLFYQLSKYLHTNNVSLDQRYSKLGVSRFIGDRYYRYICYDTFLLDVEYYNPQDLSSKNYHNIKKIALIDEHGDIKENLTDAKNNFYDVKNTTRLQDMITFYNMSKFFPSLHYKNNTIKVTYEYFDTDILEHITTHEEFQLE